MEKRQKVVVKEIQSEEKAAVKLCKMSKRRKWSEDGDKEAGRITLTFAANL